MEPSVGQRRNNGLEEFVITGGDAKRGWEVFLPATLARKTMSDADVRKEKDTNAPAVGQRRETIDPEKDPKDPKSVTERYVIYAGNAMKGWNVSVLKGESAGQQKVMSDGEVRSGKVVL